MIDMGYTERRTMLAECLGINNQNRFAKRTETTYSAIQ